MLGKKRKRRINRILIVEDEPLVAFDNERFLTEAGYEVIASVDRVDDAISVIRADGLDLVLADVALAEGESGIEVARAASERRTPLLFVSGHCPLEARKLAVGCLAKPYMPRELLGAIEAVESLIGGKSPKRPPAGLSLYGVPD